MTDAELQATCDAYIDWHRRKHGDSWARALVHGVDLGSDERTVFATYRRAGKSVALEAMREHYNAEVGKTVAALRSMVWYDEATEITRMPWYMMHDLTPRPRRNVLAVAVTQAYPRRAAAPEPLPPEPTPPELQPVRISFRGDPMEIAGFTIQTSDPHHRFTWPPAL